MLPATRTAGLITCRESRQFSTSSPLGQDWEKEYQHYKLQQRSEEYPGARKNFGESDRSEGYQVNRGDRGGYGGSDRGGYGSSGGYGGRDSSWDSGSRGGGYGSSSGFGRDADRVIRSDGFYYPEGVETHGMAGHERKLCDWSKSTNADAHVERQLFGHCKAPTSNLMPPTDIKITSTDSSVHESVTTWQDMNLGEIVTRNLELMKLPGPTPVQSYAMPIILAGRGYNLLASAQTGSGKTAAFLAPAIGRLCREGPPDMYKNDSTTDVLPLVLVISPTRELCQQIFEEAQKLTYRSQIRSYACYGGTNIGQNINGLQKGTELLVSTPGRLKDLVNRGVVSLRCVQTLILDEADHMLDMGFSRDINEICFKLDMSPKKQTLLFSATFPPDIMGLAKSIMAGGGQATVKIAIGRCGSTSDTIEQKFVSVSEGFEKKRKLIEIMQTLEPGSKSLIFSRTKAACQFLTNELQRNGYDASYINSDLSQGQRQSVMSRFKSGKTKVLVATEVAARGLDVPAIEAVINYDMPDTIDQYVHRIGRTGRVGKKGTAISMFNMDKDRKLLHELKSLLQETKQEMPDFMSNRGMGYNDYNSSRDYERRY